MLFLMSLLVTEANAAYLCGLTSVDIQDVIDYYAQGTPFSEVTPYVSSPFTCSTYGDLCEIVNGAINAENFVCARWGEALAHTSGSSILSNAEASAKSYEESWISGTAGYGGCIPLTPTDRRKYNQNASHATQWNGWRINTWIYNEIGTSVRALYCDSTWEWKKDTSGDVYIEYNFYSTDGPHTTCPIHSGKRTDNDGYKRKVRSTVFTYAALPETVYSTAWYAARGPRTATRIGTWNDPFCP